MYSHFRHKNSVSVKQGNIPLTHALTHSLTHSLTYSLTHSFTLLSLTQHTTPQHEGIVPQAHPSALGFSAVLFATQLLVPQPLITHSLTHSRGSSHLCSGSSHLCCYYYCSACGCSGEGEEEDRICHYDHQRWYVAVV